MIEAYCFLNIVYRIGLSLQQRKKHAVYFNYSEEKFYFYYIFLGGELIAAEVMFTLLYMYQTGVEWTLTRESGT